MEGLSEKHWGEILERTVSSNSLQAMQRVSFCFYFRKRKLNVDVHIHKPLAKLNL